MKKFTFGVVFTILNLVANATPAATLFTFEVEKTANQPIYLPLEVVLNTKVGLKVESLQLVQLKGGKRIQVPFQLNGNRLSWIAKSSQSTLKFELETSNRKKRFSSLGSNTANGLLTISFGKQNLLGYQFGHMAPPEGVDPAYGRSGFIHPLWSPKGQILTRIQPEDHYHHYGIWNPWTHLSYAGKEYDLWNLAKKQGSVRFSKFKNRADGPIFSEYTAIHEHVVFPSANKETVIMEEHQTVRVYRPASAGHYIMDMTIDLRAVTDKPVTLLEYRYGGFGWRATEQWHKDNSEIMSSEGLDRSKIDGTLGRWFYVQGEVDNDYAGAAVMSHPGNFNHPEPMRMWPINPGSRGDVYASFSPTKNTDWVIKLGNNYVRRYRFVVYNGKMNRQNTEQAWQIFALPPSIKVSSIYTQNT